MKGKNNKINGIVKLSIILSIIFCSIIFSANAASAADKTYYWTPSSGAIDSSGFTANWGGCNAQPTSYRVTTLSSTEFTCSSDRLTRTSSGDQFLAIYPTAYSSDTQIVGKTGATFYLSSQRSGYTATYRFDLGYATGGTFTSLGYVTRSVSSSSGQSYTIDMNSISGTAPSGSYPALKVSVTTYRGGRVYLGTNGGSTGSNSGRFYINETASEPTPTPTPPPTPTYNVTITASPTTGDTTAGNSFTYNIIVNNTGNTNGNYTLNVTDSDSVNFQSSVLGTTNLLINSGSSAQTTLIVSAKTTAVVGAINTATIIVDSIEDPIYTDSTQTTTTVVSTPPPPPTDYKIVVSTDRYSIFSPWTGKASDTSLSANFTGYALLLDSDGKPAAGQGITFKIYSGISGNILKVTKTATTQANGLASVPYDTYPDFSSSSDSDYGTWKIEAYMTNSPGIIASTNMKIEAGGTAINTGCENNCHKTGISSGSNPKSPYTDRYGQTSSRAVAAHQRGQHQSYGCYLCHPGYSATKTGSYGNTGDVHSGRTCDYCHGTWSTIDPTGIPRMPSCYECHPVLNNNPSIVSTLANLAGGNGISVYSFNFDQKKPLAAHTGGLVDSVPCIVCHGPAHNNSKPYNAVSSSNSITENEQCWTCHTDRATTHMLNTNCISCHSQNAHNISIAGGPDCISCHGTAGSATHKIDENAIAAGEHANLNSGATANGVSAANKKCWGCHQTGGIQPADMGDRYTNPYKCYDCHNATKPYNNVAGALTVSEHFKSGTDIQSAISAANDSASCITCHSVPEMKVSYTENDGLNSEASLASHYGKNRGELRTGEGGSTDCNYCHQNASTVFSIAMSNPENKNMINHSTSTSTPVCTTCHSTGKLHDSSLSKPASSNDAYCQTCHTDRNEHKTLYCTECHANNTDGSKAGKDIHGIKFLQKDNTFSQNKINAVDCPTCHQSNAVDSSLGTFTAEKTDVLHHSDTITNGTRWGTYWVNSGEACLYCHNDTRHNATPLGRTLLWNPFYQMRTNIGTDTNCADCHYQGDTNYTIMSSVLMGAGLTIPPEITSGSWNGKPGYYNHTLSDYTDSQCKSCHYRGSGTTVGQMLHDTSEGTSGGPDCKACHDVGGSAPKLINFSVANNSGHKNLNSAASSTVNAENKKCWACHGDGAQPASGHPASYKTPSSCETCHTGAGGYTAPLVKEHVQNGADVHTAVNCSLCHDNNGMYLDGAGSGTVTHYLKDVTNTATTPYGHLGPIDTSDCLICHNGIYTGDPVWGSPVNITTSPKRVHMETSNAQCDICHKDGAIQTLANVDFHNSSLAGGTEQGPNCLACHASAE